MADIVGYKASDGSSGTIKSFSSVTLNINMQAAFHNAFSLASFSQPTTLAQTRITAFEELRLVWPVLDYGGYFITSFQTVSGSGFTPTQTGAQTVDIACPTDAFDFYVNGVYQSTITRPSGVYTYTTSFTADDQSINPHELAFVYPSTGTDDPPTAAFNIIYSYSNQDPDYAWQGLQNPVRSWKLFMADYFTESNAGIDLSLLLTDYNTSPSYATKLQALISSDLALINAQTNTGYVLQNVLDGTETVSSADISATRSAIELGQYTRDIKLFITGQVTTAITPTTIVATTTSSEKNITFDNDVTYIDLTMILDPPDISTRVRGWFAIYPYYNGYHLSNKYSVRVYLNDGQTKRISLQSGTSRDINNLLNGQFITLDTLLSISLTREEFTPEDSDSTVIIDSDFIVPDSDIIFGVDSTGALNFGSRITLQNWIIGQDSATGGFNITYKNTDKDVLQLDQTGVLDVDSAINGGDF